MSERKFHHITEDERKKAIELWNKFNEDLANLGMELHYDYDMGNFIVADKVLKPGSFRYKNGNIYDPVPEDEFTLTKEELEQVIEEGGFDRTAVNNPPWFLDHTSYTLKVPGGKQG